MECLKPASGDLGVVSVEKAVALQTAVPRVDVADGASVEVASVFGSPTHATVG